MNDVKNLAHEWDRAALIMLREEEYSIRQVERLLNETYRICTEYCTNDMVPKDICKVFLNIQWFWEIATDVYKNNDPTTSSDCADIDAIDYILDAIEHGFYAGKYDYAYPQIAVTDNKKRVHIYDLNKSFLEDFIDALE